MPKKEQFFASGTNLLCIGAILVMIVFIVLWSKCKNSKKNMITKSECLQKASEIQNVEDCQDECGREDPSVQNKCKKKCKNDVDFRTCMNGSDPDRSYFSCSQK